MDVSNYQATGRRRRKENNFVMIQNSMFEDNRLSWKAKGLLGYMLSRPDNWIIRTSDLIKRSTDGERAVKSAIKELKETGYLVIHKLKNNKGQFIGADWVYDDVPFSCQTESAILQPVENARVENAEVENSTNINNTDFNNTNLKKNNNTKRTKNKRKAIRKELVPDWLEEIKLDTKSTEQKIITDKEFEEWKRNKKYRISI